MSIGTGPSMRWRLPGTTARAYRSPPRDVALSPRPQRPSDLSCRSEPIDHLALAQRLGQKVQAVPEHAEYALHTGRINVSANEVGTVSICMVARSVQRGYGSTGIRFSWPADPKQIRVPDVSHTGPGTTGFRRFASRVRQANSSARASGRPQQEREPGRSFTGACSPDKIAKVS